MFSTVRANGWPAWSLPAAGLLLQRGSGPLRANRRQVSRPVTTYQKSVEGTSGRRSEPRPAHPCLSCDAASQPSTNPILAVALAPKTAQSQIAQESGWVGVLRRSAMPKVSGQMSFPIRVSAVNWRGQEIEGWPPSTRNRYLKRTVPQTRGIAWTAPTGMMIATGNGSTLQVSIISRFNLVF